jgi:hypothetical protein
LMPAQYVKPYVKTNKSDYIDAEAIAEAVQRPRMRFVPRWQWVSPTLSKPDLGKGLFQAVQFIGTKASGHPSWPGVTDSTQGRIHWRRPAAILRFSLATLRRTIHTENPALSGAGPPKWISLAD